MKLVRWLGMIIFGVFLPSCFVTNERLTLAEIFAIPALGKAIPVDLPNKGTAWSFYFTLDRDTNDKGPLIKVVMINTSQDVLDIVLPPDDRINKVSNGGEIVLWQGALSELQGDRFYFLGSNGGRLGGRRIGFTITIQPSDGREIANVGGLKIVAATSDGF